MLHSPRDAINTMNTVINLTKSTVPPGAEPSKMRQHFLEHQHETFTINLNYAQACALWDLLALVNVAPPIGGDAPASSAVRHLVRTLHKTLPSAYVASGDLDIFSADILGNIRVTAIPDDTAEFFQP